MTEQGNTNDKTAGKEEKKEQQSQGAPAGNKKEPQGASEEKAGNKKEPQGASEEKAGNKKEPQGASEEKAGNKKEPQGASEEKAGNKKEPQGASEEKAGNKKEPQGASEEKAGNKKEPQGASEEKAGNEKDSGEDIEKVKAVAAIAYLIFFLPLLVNPESKFGRFHANQGLLLLISSCVVSIVGSIVPIIGWFIILPFGSIFLLILFVLGIINATNGKTERLPLIGEFDIIK